MLSSVASSTGMQTTAYDGVDMENDEVQHGILPESNLVTTTNESELVKLWRAQV